MSKGKNFGIRIPGPAEAHPAIRKAFQQILARLGYESEINISELTLSGDLEVSGGSEFEDVSIAGMLTVSGDTEMSDLSAETIYFYTVDSLPSPVVLGEIVRLSSNNRLYYGV